MTKQILEYEIERILGIKYFYPRVWPSIERINEPICKRWFCGAVEIHTHSPNAKFVMPLVKLFSKDDKKRKYNTKDEVFKALFKKVGNLYNDSSIIPRDGKIETQKQLMMARFRDLIREVEDKDALYEKVPDYETL